MSPKKYRRYVLKFYGQGEDFEQEGNMNWWEAQDIFMKELGNSPSYIEIAADVVGDKSEVSIEEPCEEFDLNKEVVWEIYSLRMTINQLWSKAFLKE